MQAVGNFVVAKAAKCKAEDRQGCILHDTPVVPRARPVDQLLSLGSCHCRRDIGELLIPNY